MTGVPLDGAGASSVTDHPFKPRGEWFTTCAVCGLAEAAHLFTTRSGSDDDR